MHATVSETASNPAHDHTVETGAPDRIPPRPGSTVSLFVTCVVDQIAPEVGAASVRLLEAAGYVVRFPEEQACCGQPALSDGRTSEAARMARATVDAMDGAEAVIIPSGSCAAMIRHHYADLPMTVGARGGDSSELLAERTWELTELLAAHPPEFANDGDGDDATVVTYHDSCHGLRSLGIRSGPRSLLRAAGYRVTEMVDPEVCCGFGGVFSALQPEISTALADDKIEMARGAARIVAAGDVACLRHLEGRSIATLGPGEIRFAHVAELLAEALPSGSERA